MVKPYAVYTREPVIVRQIQDAPAADVQPFPMLQGQAADEYRAALQVNVSVGRQMPSHIHYL